MQPNKYAIGLSIIIVITIVIAWIQFTNQNYGWKQVEKIDHIDSDKVEIHHAFLNDF